MNLFQVSGITALAATIILGILVFLTQPRRHANQAFILLCGTLSVWLLCLVFGSVAVTETAAMFWIRQASATAAVIPVMINLLRLSIVYPEWNLGRIMRNSLPLFLVYLLLAGLCQTPFFLRAAMLPDNPRDIAIPVYGLGFVVFAVYMLVSLAMFARLLQRDLSAATGIQRSELHFILLSCLSALFFGILFLLVPNLTGLVELGQMLPLSVVLFNVTMAYGIAATRILDVPNVIRRMTSNAVLVLALILVYLAVWLILNAAVNAFMATALPLAHLGAALVTAFVMTPAQGMFQAITSKMFMKSPSVDYAKTMEEAGLVLNSVSRTDDLFHLFAAMVERHLQVREVTILLLQSDRYTTVYAESAEARPALSFSREDAIPALLSQWNGPLVFDMIPRMRSSDLLTESQRTMGALKVATACGIRYSGELTGIVLLGSRRAGRIFGGMEQQVLTGLCQQLASALENAKLYTEVQDSRIYNETLLENLVSGVIAANNQKRITTCNREAARIAGIDPVVLEGAPIHQLPRPLYQLLAASYDSQREIRDQQVILNDGEGNEIFLNAGSSLFYSHAGDPLGALLVFNDVTAVKKLESQVRRTDRLASLGTLSAGMAHEIKNPLVTLKTFTQLLPERYEDADFRDTFSSLVGQEVKRIDSIVNQLLRFARPAKPKLEPTPLHIALEKTSRLVHQQMRQKGIQPLERYDAERDVILGDGDLLVQAFLNLMMNAIDAMPDGGVLSIITRVFAEEAPEAASGQRDMLEVSIGDTGKGIDAESLQHVFDPFFTTKDTGTGLGLSVSHQIIQEHNAIVDVFSSVGEGTTFRLRFPLIRQEVTS
ncbi:MAG: PAS domain-containing protein [Verrucomicrobia bacterium]|nr:PAS domain-containing protein [Verrucomicrobiota bacterium]